MRARAGGRVADPAERVIDYMTALARDQDVHVVTLDAIIGACDVMPLKWPDLFEKHLTDMVEAVPGRDAYRLRKKRSDLMARLTDEERVVGHLLEVGVASPADIRRALSLAESDTKGILHRLAVDGRAQYEGRGRGVRWSLVETRPVPPPVEASPVVEERAVPATDAAAVAVATAHEFRAIAQALGLGPSATAGEVAETVLLWVADVGRVVALEKRVAELEALEGALQLTERERDEAREEAAGWRARAERALAEGQAAAAQLEEKRLEVLDRSRAHADMAAERDEARAQRNEARGQRDAVERRAEATNDALWKLRKRAHRKLERARDRLAKAQNGLDVIESVPLADAGIPF